MLKKLDEEDSKQKNNDGKVVLREIEDMNSKSKFNDKAKILGLKETINTKLSQFQTGNTDEALTLKEIQQKREWVLNLKTHIAKFQSELLAFSLRKYFKRWKSKAQLLYLLNEFQNYQFHYFYQKNQKKLYYHYFDILQILGILLVLLVHVVVVV